MSQAADIATTYQTRTATLIARYGETFTMGHSGSTRTLTGVFALVGSVPAGTYFDEDEQLSLIRPLLSLYLDGTLASDPPILSETLTRDGRDFIVQRTVIHRIAGVAITVQVLLD